MNDTRLNQIAGLVREATALTEALTAEQPASDADREDLFYLSTYLGWCNTRLKQLLGDAPCPSRSLGGSACMHHRGHPPPHQALVGNGPGTYDWTDESEAAKADKWSRSIW